LAVADVYDAMTSHRSYRPAHSIEEALGELIKNKEVLYDPQVVDALISLVRDGIIK
jgi:HD-GYP domain-containing protein (c-di-GMP phosphodiesterase class II)